MKYLPIILSCLLLPITVPPDAVAGQAVSGEASYAEFKRTFLQEQQGPYDRVIAAYADDAAIRAFQQRVATLGRVVGLLIDGFEASKAASLASMLQGLEEMPASAAPTGPSGSALMAMDILSEYEPYFAAGLPTPPIKEEELAVLRDYYRGVIEAAQAYVGKRGRVVAAISDRSRIDAVQLGLVLHFLHVDDQAWTRDHIESLPEWMKQPTGLRAVERFALRLRRTRTAYAFVQYMHESRLKGGRPLDYAQYLRAAARQAQQDRDFHAAVYCLRAAVAESEPAGDHEQTAQLRFDLAALYAEAGHPQLAADEITVVLSAQVQPDTYGRAAMLRLKYLYEADQFDVIVKESPGYQADDRCRIYLPQVIYITWVACRRVNDEPGAEQLSNVFLERFPRHPLGADIHFGAAMKMLSKSDYEGAQRRLEIIEYHYPASHLTRKVKELQERLDKKAQEHAE